MAAQITLQLHAIFFLILAGMLFAVDAPGQGTAAGFIESISANGKVTLQTARSSRPLNSTADRSLILRSGDKLACEGGAKVMGVLMDAGPIPKPKDLCNLTIPARTSSESAADQGLSYEAAEKLQEYSLAGRSKGFEPAIFEPPNNGAVVAKDFVIRWSIRPPLDNFTAILQKGDDEIARVAGVDGGKGELDSAVFRVALVSLSTASSASPDLKIVFRFENGSQQAVAFTVLTQEQEQRLQQELSRTTMDGIFRFVERAAIYDFFRLYGLVAAEYDHALTDAPESRTLLHAAMQAYARVGDLKRAREMNDRLEKIEEANPQ